MTTHSPNGPEDYPVERRDSDARPFETIEAEITELYAHISAATYRLLVLIAELDRRDGWGNYGLSSSAHWLNWKCGIGFNAAREKVRVARALEHLPQISAAFEKGMVSYSKVRAMTRVATPENEDFLLEVARNGTAAHVENLVRGYRGVLRAEERERADALHEQREVYWRIQEDGSLLLYARLPPEQSALVIKALDFVMNRLYDPEHEQREPEDPTEDAPGYFMGDPTNEPFAALRADALVLMAEYALANPEAPVRPGERHQVVVHVDAERGTRVRLALRPWVALP